MTEQKDRREFIKSTAAIAMGLLGGLGLASKVLAQAKVQPLNQGAKALEGIKVQQLPRGGELKLVMPDGSLKTRGEILRGLGLNPNTSPDAWLAGCGGGCGSNAAALDMNARQKLMQRGFKFEGNELTAVPVK